MANLRENLKSAAADCEFDSHYLIPDFWLSGKYTKYQTQTIEFIPLGPEVVDWLWRAGGQSWSTLADEMLSITSVPRNPTQFQLFQHAWHRPYEMYYMKGVTDFFSQFPKNDPRYLSETVRQEMTAFTDSHPFLLDVLRTKAQDDFMGITGMKMTVGELQMYPGRMPGKTFRYWERLFPDLIGRIYTDIQRDAEGKVMGYEIQSVSYDFIRMSEKDPEK